MKTAKILFVILFVVGLAHMVSAQNQYASRGVRYLEYWAMVTQSLEGTTVTLGLMRGVGKTVVTPLPVKTKRGFLFKQVGADSITVEDGAFVLKYKKVPADCELVKDVDKVVLEFFKLVAVDATEIRQKFVKKTSDQGNKTYTVIQCPDQ